MFQCAAGGMLIGVVILLSSWKVLEHADRFRGGPQSGMPPGLPAMRGLQTGGEDEEHDLHQRYRVNVVVDHEGAEGDARRLPVDQDSRNEEDRQQANRRSHRLVAAACRWGLRRLAPPAPRRARPAG